MESVCMLEINFAKIAFVEINFAKIAFEVMMN